MRTVVTGAAGFIGSHLAERLCSVGDTVLGLDNFNDYYNPRYKFENASSVMAAGGMIEVVDVADAGRLLQAVRALRPDRIVHLAALAGVRNSIERPSDYVATNVVGTSNVLDAARHCGVGAVVLASTSSVYGGTTRIPFVENDPAVDPLQPYAATKRAAELLGSVHHQVYGTNVTVLRFFTVYGPRGRPDMMPYKLVESAASGSPVPYFGDSLARDWTFVDDVVQGIVLAADRPAGFRVLNVGRGKPLSLGEFVAAVAEVAGRMPNLIRQGTPPSEMLTTAADISAARQALGFAPKVDVREGVAHLWDWYSEHRIGLSRLS